ncbi:MAG: hypothetical protein UT55_C0073G0007 [Candidatus Peregrinibacteria bacterium GW2011_GWE2_39_6]|nr:MAG: hypothetical protein UT55_C0073G0007 [Candidatus Peregrinibacteria bacterium GW2011_GWE2_39_6]
MQFKYTATNPQGKKLSGIINAASDAVARTQLNNLGFSILEMHSSNETELGTSSVLQKFEFEALDKNGKKIIGTIPAHDSLAAYRRLVEEYSFNVIYLVSQFASASEKEQIKVTGVQALKEAYQTEQSPHPVVTESIQAQVETPEFLLEKKELTDLIELIIKALTQLIARFEAKIRPESRAGVEAGISKLLRIKSSNNLDYIRHSCHELLQHLKGTEFFISNLISEDERGILLLEVERLDHLLNKNTAFKIGVGDQIRATIHDFELKAQKSSWHFLGDFLKYFEDFLKSNPQLQQFKTEIKDLRYQEWDTLLRIIRGSKETRGVLWEDLKQIHSNLIEKRKQYHFFKKDMERGIYFVEEFNAFMGWLLGFYLIYYFLGYYSTFKGVEVPILGSRAITFEDSILFKYLLVFVFILHGLASLKVNFFNRTRRVDSILVVVGIMLILFSFFNL